MAKTSAAKASARSQPIAAPNYRTAATRRTVRLTFDDGPHPTYTPQVLQALADHGVKATFFVVGRNVAAYPAIVKSIAAAGHQIGNHSFSHANLSNLSPKDIRAELTRTEKLIAPYLGKRKLFRPPYGAHNAKVDAVVAELGCSLILWNVDTLDWNKSFQPTKWVLHGLDQIRARDTSNVLCHDIHRTTAAHLDKFIARIKALGSVKFELQP
ncbi:MAG: polysaccharide deacetylase family protein [Methylocystis sp.]|nr:polysaccharide deacetylase family protein [Methylocystis sp.]